MLSDELDAAKMGGLKGGLPHSLVLEYSYYPICEGIYMKPRVILNPYAGRWTAQERRQEAEHALQAVGLDFDLVTTERPGHGSQLAAQAVLEGCPIVISAGGDGSVSEVVNGLLQAQQANVDLPTLGIHAHPANRHWGSIGIPCRCTGCAWEFRAHH